MCRLEVVTHQKISETLLLIHDLWMFFYRNYEDVLKLLKWPFSAPPEHPPAPKEVMVKFNSLTKYLFLIEEPEELVNNNVTTEAWQGKAFKSNNC